MAGMDLTTEVDALKLRYSDDFVKTMVYKENRLLALMPKDEEFRKHKYVQPINYGDPQALSPTFSDAQTQAATESQRIDRSEVPHVRLYGVITIDDLLLEMAQGGDKNVFYSTFVSKADGILHSTSRQLTKALHGNGWGKIGTVGGTPGGDTSMQLSDIADASNFEVGMSIQFAASEAADALRDTGEAVKVTAVNRNTGVITLSANETSIASIAAGDSIFQKGMRQDSATPARIIATGVNAWVVPSDGSASSDLHGINQTLDTRLAGVNYNGTSDGVLDATFELFDRIDAQGGKPDVYFVNPKQATNIKKELMAQGISHDMVKVKAQDANVWFAGVMFSAPFGDIAMVSDRDCQRRYGKALQMDTFKLVSAGPAPRILNPDGLDRLRGSSSNDIEIRVGYYANCVNKAPGFSGIVTLPTPAAL